MLQWGMKKLEPDLTVLPEGQRELWNKLGESLPDKAVLYGGTAIALQLGHRESVDFDFFVLKSTDVLSLTQTLPYLKDCEVLFSTPDTLTCNTAGPNPVKVSFFSLPDLQQAAEPLSTANGVTVASLLDLAATKVKVVQDRAEAKDYKDLYALISGGHVTLLEALQAAQRVYGPKFDVGGSLRALSYYTDGNLRSLDAGVRDFLTRAAAEIDLSKLQTDEGGGS